MAVPTYRAFSDFAASLGATADGVDDASAHRLEAIHPAPYVSPAFRTGYFSVVLVAAGRGRYWLDGTEYPTRAGTVYFTNPGHLKGFALDDGVRGRVLTFTEAFLKRHAHAAVFDDLPFLLAETAPPFHADAATFAALDAVAAQIEDALARPSPSQPRIVAALFVVLLLRLRDAFWDDYEPRADRGSAIVAAFHRDLEAQVRALVAGDAAAPPAVADLAAAQALHPNYLSTVIKAKTGRTVGEWTADKLAAEARALLSAPGASVKGVAAALGFAEPTGFARFFRRATGQSPSAFRQAGAAPA